MLKRIPALVLAVHATIASAQDHLVPDDTIFTVADVYAWQGNTWEERSASLQQALERQKDRLVGFEDAFSEDVRARVLVFPSFESGYAVGVREANDSFSIFSFVPNVNLFDSETGNVVPDDEFCTASVNVQSLACNPTTPEWRLLDIDSCNIDISNSLANDLIALWDAMLMETRYAEPHRPSEGQTEIRIRGDGTNYHFSMRINTERFSGTTWSPAPETKPGRLVAISDAMKEVCANKAGSLMRELEIQTSELLQSMVE